VDRSLYPEGVEVHQRDLVRTETTKIDHIKRRLQDVAITGVLSGGAVTPNGVLVTVNPFTGYTNGGEYVSYNNTESLSLIDYTSGAKNYVVAVYTEQDTNLEPHETNGESYPTSAVASLRLVVLSASEYASLPATDSNLSNNALDRVLLLAVVTASGTGISLTNANITYSSDFGGAIIATNTTGNIGGVTVLNTEKTTPTGNGVLALTVAGPVKTVTWKAPNDGFAGSAVDISVSGTYVLYSGNALQYIRISVIGSSLPVASISDTIQISNIYAQTVPRFSAEDIQHRTMIGTGALTSTNPHGLTAADLGVSDLFSNHQQIFHNNGILPGSSASFLNTTVFTSGADALDIGAPSSGDRFYVNGNVYNDVGMGAGESVLRRLSFVGLDNTQILFDIYIKEGTGGIGIPVKKERARFSMPTSTLINRVQLRAVSDNTAAGYAYIYFSGAVLQYKAPGESFYGPAVTVPSIGTPQVLRLWNSTLERYIDVYVNSSGGSTTTATLYISDLFTGVDVTAHMKIASVMWYNDELGNGFPITGNNITKDQRTYGMMCANTIRDDIGKWEFGYPSVNTEYPAADRTKLSWITEKDGTTTNRSLRSIASLRQVTIGTNTQPSNVQLYVKGFDANRNAIVGDASQGDDVIGVLGYGTGGGGGVFGVGLNGGIGVTGVGDDGAYGVYGVGGGIGAALGGDGVRGIGGLAGGHGVSGLGGVDAGSGVFGQQNGPGNGESGVAGVGFNAAAYPGESGGTGVGGAGGAGGSGADGGVGVVGYGGAPGAGGVGGTGGSFVSGSGGIGVYATASGTAVRALATGNGAGVVATGAGSGIGVDVTSSTGIGIRVITSGGNHAGSFTTSSTAATPCVEVINNAGSGLNVSSVNDGTNLCYGIYVTSNSSGAAAISATNSNGDGIYGFTSTHGVGVTGSGVSGGGYGVYAAGKATPTAAGDKAPFRMTPITATPNSVDAGAFWFNKTTQKLTYNDGSFTYTWTPSTIV
jgi:hypothetical protein